MITKYNKYHNRKTEIDGIKFDSKREANRYIELKLMEQAKAIQDLKLQVKFPLVKKSSHGQEVVYVADFVYYEDGKMVVEDSKGYRTDVYKLKKRLMAELYGIDIKET